MKLHLYLILLVLLSSLADAAGVGPARNSFIFQPGESLQGYFYVNPDEFPARVQLKVFGSVEPFVDLQTIQLEIQEPMTKVAYTVNFPDELHETLTGGIEVLFVKEVQDSSQISTEVKLIHQIWIVDDEALVDAPPRVEQPLDIKKSFSFTPFVMTVVLLIVILLVFEAKSFIIKPEISLHEQREIRDYIKKMRARKIPDSLIESNLLKAGWSKKVVRKEMKS